MAWVVAKECNDGERMQCPCSPRQRQSVQEELMHWRAPVSWAIWEESRQSPLPIQQLLRADLEHPPQSIQCSCSRQSPSECDTTKECNLRYNSHNHHHHHILKRIFIRIFIKLIHRQKLVGGGRWNCQEHWNWRGSCYQLIIQFMAGDKKVNNWRSSIIIVRTKFT